MLQNDTRTFPRGEDHASSTLKESDIHDIDRMWAQGYTQQVIADLIGITQPYVVRILKRQNWSHVPILTPAPPGRRTLHTNHSRYRDAVRNDWSEDRSWTLAALGKKYGISEQYVCLLVRGLPPHRR